MRHVFIAALLAACATTPSAAQTPDWMVGYWLSCGNGRQVSETWTGAGSGVLVGTGLTRSPRGIDFEFLRIAPHEGGLAYFGSPRGAPPTAFRMVKHEGASAVFENLAHDFPQRIRYARDGDTMTARVESADGAQGMSWRFTRAPLDQACPAG
ncbi:MAG: DUF6265 family protein [Alphaproteobacteria bacterium]|nr:DUF6265 family protein [Alphaproteobacteria bacterium]